jgi:hypothetical protein
LDGDLEVVLASEGDDSSHFRGVSGTRDDSRSPIVDRVPETARIVVGGVIGRDDVGTGPAKLIEMARRESDPCVGHRSLPRLSAAHGHVVQV